MKTLVTEPKWTTVDEYAEVMGRHPATVRRMCNKGEVPAERNGSSWRIYYEPPNYSLQMSDAAEEAVHASMRACTAVLAAAITSLQQMMEDLNKIDEGICGLCFKKCAFLIVLPPVQPKRIQSGS